MSIATVETIDTITVDFSLYQQNWQISWKISKIRRNKTRIGKMLDIANAVA